MNRDSITSIRILPSAKTIFEKESEFKFFIENTMVARDGDYYFPSLMMNCPTNTLVLFQYDGMIRAIGILIDMDKRMVVDEHGVKYAGYYRFDTDTLAYLDTPLDKDMLKSAYPSFSSFSQVKQMIPLEYLDDILDLLQRTNGVSDDNETSFISEIENTNMEGAEKVAFVKIRVNQGVFRDKLLKKYSKCCLCGVSDKFLLIASHLKPWGMSSSKEKLDVENGFLFCPNHDKLFDGGWISFEDDGTIIISDTLKQNERIFMNIRKDMNIVLSEKNKKYLEFHRDNVFRDYYQYEERQEQRETR